MKFALLSVLAVFPIVTAHAETKPSEATAPAKVLQSFFDAEWDYTMEHNPTWASTLGDRRWNGRWDDNSLEANAKQEAHAKDALQRLSKIDRANLIPSDQLNYDLFKKNLETDIEGLNFRMNLLQINQRGGIQTADELGDQLRFETIKDYE